MLPWKTVPFLPEGNRRLIVPSFPIHQTQTLEGDVRGVSVSHFTLAFCVVFTPVCLHSVVYFQTNTRDQIRAVFCVLIAHSVSSQ